jgi:predicted transcriptional regulator
MNKDAFAKKLAMFRGRYKDIAAETGVSHALVRKYARGYMPKGSTLDAEKIATWMRGRRP